MKSWKTSCCFGVEQEQLGFNRIVLKRGSITNSGLLRMSVPCPGTAIQTLTLLYKTTVQQLQLEEAYGIILESQEEVKKTCSNLSRHTGQSVSSFLQRNRSEANTSETNFKVHLQSLLVQQSVWIGILACVMAGFLASDLKTEQNKIKQANKITIDLGLDIQPSNKALVSARSWLFGPSTHTATITATHLLPSSFKEVQPHQEYHLVEALKTMKTGQPTKGFPPVRGTRN